MPLLFTWGFSGARCVCSRRLLNLHLGFSHGNSPARYARCHGWVGRRRGEGCDSVGGYRPLSLPWLVCGTVSDSGRHSITLVVMTHRGQTISLLAHEPREVETRVVASVVSAVPLERT